MAPQNITVVMTNGTNDSLRCAIAVVTAFGMRKNGHNVTIVMMGEAGSVVDDTILRATNGFGLPPMAALLDKPEMADVEWLV